MYYGVLSQYRIYREIRMRSECVVAAEKEGTIPENVSNILAVSGSDRRMLARATLDNVGVEEEEDGAVVGCTDREEEEEEEGHRDFERCSADAFIDVTAALGFKLLPDAPL